MHDYCPNGTELVFADGSACPDEPNPCTYDVCENKICKHPHKPDCVSCGQESCIQGSCMPETCTISVTGGQACPGGSAEVTVTGTCAPMCIDTVSWSITSSSPYIAGSGGSVTCGDPPVVASVTVSGEAPAGSIPITITGTTPRGAQCSAQATIQVAELVDLTFDNLSDQDEYSPGGFLALNDTDDNDNDIVDMTETGVDPDVKALTVSIDPSLTEGTVTLSSPSGGGPVRLYEDPARTMPLPPLGQMSWNAADLAQEPVTLYVEGILVSNAARDVRLWLNYDGPDDETCVDTIRLTVLAWEINTVGFDSAHDPPMIDNNTDYEPTGPDFEEPEWFPAWTPPRNAPFSHTMDSNVTVKIITTLFPLDLPAMDFEFIGDGPQGFNFEETVSLHGGNNFPELTSTDVLERKIQKLSVDIDWALRRNGSTVIRQATGPHTAYITMGPPRDRNYPQHVVTIKRMERAVQEVEATGSLDPHTIVASVIAAQGTYDLDAFRDNAWTVPDFAINHRGDCATIVRYTKKVAFMTGVPGQFAHVLVYATDAAPETPIVTTGTDSLCNPWIPHNVNTTWKLQLEDGDGDNNCFEAAARFNYDNVELYYPGGIPGSSTGDPRDILHAFVGLSWYEFVPPWAFRERMYTYP